MAQKTILIVDDEVMLVDMISMRLESNDYDVESAYDGLDGLAKANELRPELIILDVNMPGMDGLSVLREIRKSERLKNTKVVMLTASGKMKDIFEQEGISDFITKPFDTEDFLKRIDKAIKKRK